MTSNLLNDAIGVIRGERRLSRLDAMRALRHLIETARTQLRALEDAEYEASRRPTPILVRAHHRDAIKAQATAQARKLKEKAAQTALSVYRAITLGGKAVGEVWYDELIAIRSESRFAASLADQLMNCGIPDRPTQIKSMVSEARLSQMIERAKEDAARK